MHEDFASYPLYLRQQGYTNVAIHPYLRSFYDREDAYADMGFDSFYDMEDFADPTYAGDYISERVPSTSSLIPIKKRPAKTDGGVFIHTVTIQNHVSYTGGIYPDGYRVTPRCRGSTRRRPPCWKRWPPTCGTSTGRWAA